MRSAPQHRAQLKPCAALASGKPGLCKVSREPIADVEAAINPSRPAETMCSSREPLVWRMSGVEATKLPAPIASRMHTVAKAIRGLHAPWRGSLYCGGACERRPYAGSRATKLPSGVEVLATKSICKAAKVQDALPH